MCEHTSRSRPLATLAGLMPAVAHLLSSPGQSVRSSPAPRGTPKGWKTNCGDEHSPPSVRCRTSSLLMSQTYTKPSTGMRGTSRWCGIAMYSFSQTYGTSTVRKFLQPDIGLRRRCIQNPLIVDPCWTRRRHSTQGIYSSKLGGGYPLFSAYFHATDFAGIQANATGDVGDGLTRLAWQYGWKLGGSLVHSMAKLGPPPLFTVRRPPDG
jgi:hypothetical protein